MGNQRQLCCPCFSSLHIMMALRRLSMRAPTGVRQMSGHSIEEAIQETAKWKKVSYVFIGGVVIPFTTFSVIKHFAHHHESEERPAFPYVTKRDKHMPWTLKGGSRCDLFDYACAEKERATLKATQARRAP